MLFKEYFSQLMNYFDEVFVQSDDDLKKISKLTSKKVHFVGNLKLTSLSLINLRASMKGQEVVFSIIDLLIINNRFIKFTLKNIDIFNPYCIEIYKA